MKNKARFIFAFAFILCASFFYGAEDDEDTKIFQAEQQIQEANLSAEDIVALRLQQAMSNADYVVTAGDVYSLNYAAGTTAVSYKIPVDSTYKIRISNLAVVDAKNKKFTELKNQVESIVQKNYPLSGVQFVLEMPGAFKVSVKGEVKVVTEKDAFALTRLSEVINGTLTQYSSLRNIKIMSENGKVAEYDLFKAKRDGDFKNNPYVRPGDVVSVERIERKVSISGAVERPGTYELLNGENLKELINLYAGGLTPLADTRFIELTRISNKKEGFESGEKLYLEPDVLISNYNLECFDTVVISTFSSLKPVMFIEGAVSISDDKNGTTLNDSSKETIQFERGTDYVHLVRNNNAIFSSPQADLSKAYIVRNNQNIPLDVNKILYNAEFSSDEKVFPNDTLVVPFRQYFVTVAGAVVSPQRFPYIPDRTADYYIALAGGFDKAKNFGNAAKIVDINGKKLSKSDFITPESIITAKSNKFSYFFTQYSGFITVVTSLITTTVTVMALVNAN